MRHVEVVNVDRRRRRRLVRARAGSLDVPARRRLGHPRAAERALAVAVEVAEMRRRGVGGEEQGGGVPFFLEARAVAAAGLVAAGDEHHPFLGRVGGVRGWGEEGFVVGHGEGGYG